MIKPQKIDVDLLSANNLIELFAMYCKEYGIQQTSSDEPVTVVRAIDGDDSQTIQQVVFVKGVAKFSINKAYHARNGSVTYYYSHLTKKFAKDLPSKVTKLWSDLPHEMMQFIINNASVDPVMPIQPINKYRFVSNRIVEELLETSTLDLNDIARMGFTRNEQEQFAQLIGYSVSGFGDLSYVNSSTLDVADRIAYGDNPEDEKDMRIEELQNELNRIRQGIADTFNMDVEYLE